MFFSKPVNSGNTFFVFGPGPLRSHVIYLRLWSFDPFSPITTSVKHCWKSMDLNFLTVSPKNNILAECIPVLRICHIHMYLLTAHYLQDIGGGMVNVDDNNSLSMVTCGWALASFCGSRLPIAGQTASRLAATTAWLALPLSSFPIVVHVPVSPLYWSTCNANKS